MHLWCIDCKHKIDVATAIEINKLFYEVVIAPEYDAEELKFYNKRKQNYFNSKRSRLYPKTS
jgi:AICAR transformylase/IMP cyclohydrolase PurH